MIRIDLLKEHIKNRRIPIPEIAEKLNVSPSTFYRMLESNGEKLTIVQSLALKDVLSLSQSEYNDIFLP